VFVDFRNPEVPTEIHCDICIVGAGAAGITLALALADSGLDVHVLESGAFDPDDTTQALYDGVSAGMQNASPIGCRLRYFGGTTGRWQGWCATLRDIDFEERPWVANSGWPISKRDLDRYYERAWPICEVQPTGEAETGAQLPQFDPAKIDVGFWHFSPPTRFGTVYRDRLERAEHVSVLLNCNAVQIQTDADAASVQRLKIAALNGKTGTVSAKAYVLACGGMENTRLLLLTDDIAPAGLGNRSGTLGRFFTQHIELISARVQATDSMRLNEAFAQHRSEAVRAHLHTSSQIQQSQQLLNTGFSFGSPQQYSSAYWALRSMWRDVASGKWPDDFGEKVYSVTSDLDSVVEDIFVTRRQAPPYLDLTTYSEQTPNPDSRIGLAEATDAFGLRRIRVDWRLSAADRRSIRQSTQILAEELGRMKIGRVKLADWLVDDNAPWPQPIWGGCHHMGTTRMSGDAQSGVVNTDCRLHDVDNLYIASSSVFPTGGYVPPTLTLIALTLRLADHLNQQYA
jgi:choline dehydrogenase-like flavoprotein